MKNQTQKQKKLFIGLIIGAVLMILIGILFIAVLSKSNKELVNDAINQFMIQVKKGNLEYQHAFLQSIMKNGLECVLLFFFGMSIIGFPITIFLFLSHAFLLGFSFSSILYVYKWKGILLAIVYTLPQLLNLGIFLIFCYLSLLLSKYLFYQLILKKSISFSRIMRQYIKVFLVSLILLIISSAVEVLLVPKILSFIL